LTHPKIWNDWRKVATVKVEQAETELTSCNLNERLNVSKLRRSEKEPPVPFSHRLKSVSTRRSLLKQAN
jgi:hypothetical protein